MDVFRASPFGPYTSYELQEWIKELQFKCQQLQAIVEVSKMMVGNQVKMAEHADEMREMQAQMIDRCMERIAQLEALLYDPQRFANQYLN